MKSKQTLFIELIETHPNSLQCPHCGGALTLDGITLICAENHRFDIHKKGTLTLVKTHLLKPDPVYNNELFQARRRFIQRGFYDALHHSLKAFVEKGSVWCDMGSGEGSHGRAMLLDQEASMFGLDLSKPAIALASDFLIDGFIPIVGDLANMPLRDHCVDGILNFLSPSNELEMSRILKEDGIILKVVPGQDYLKQLRDALDMEAFEPTDYQFKYFDVVDTIHHNNELQVTEDDLKDLLAMTPLSQYKQLQTNFNTITIDLNILVLKKKEEA